MERTAAGPDAQLIDGLFGGRDQAGMIRQAQVVVGAEIEHFLAVHHQPGALRRADGADAVIQAGGFEAFNFLGDPIEFGHRDSGEEKYQVISDRFSVISFQCTPTNSCPTGMLRDRRGPDPHPGTMWGLEAPRAISWQSSDN